MPGTDLARNAHQVARLAVRYILPVMALTPFATTRSSAGRYLASVAVGTIRAPTGSYVDRNQVARSSQESYDRQPKVNPGTLSNDSPLRTPHGRAL